jgi:hypothetical protein
MTASNSASETSIVSADRIIDTMRRLLKQEITVARRFTIEQVSAESGVSIRLLRCWMSNDESENREPKLAAALSVAVVLGRRAVNAILATIGYAGTPLDEEQAAGPALVAAEMMGEVARFAKLAADNRIDHVEEPEATEAADNVIDLALPFSSRAKAS